MKYTIVNIVHNIYIYVVDIIHPEIRRYIIHKVNSFAFQFSVFVL